MIKVVKEFLASHSSNWNLQFTEFNKMDRLIIENSCLLIYLLQTQQTFVGLQDVLKTSSRNVLKTSSARLQGNNFSSSKTSWRRLANTSWRRLEDVLEDEKLLRWRHLEDILKTCLEDVLKTGLEDVLKTSKMFTGDICI